MAKKTISPENNAANQQNTNKGTSGNNDQYLAAEKNRKKQLEEHAAKKNRKEQLRKNAAEKNRANQLRKNAVEKNRKKQLEASKKKKGA